MVGKRAALLSCGNSYSAAMEKRANKAGAGSGAMRLLFQIGRLSRAVPDQRQAMQKCGPCLPLFCSSLSPCKGVRRRERRPAPDPLAFYIVSDDELVDGQFVDTPDFPQFGYIRLIPDLKLNRLKSVAAVPFQDGVPKVDTPPLDDLPTVVVFFRDQGHARTYRLRTPSRPEKGVVDSRRYTGRRGRVLPPPNLQIRSGLLLVLEETVLA